MCGIFAYLNYGVNRERRYILQVLFNGLRRLEYRGYDSAGISIDDSSSPSPSPSPSSSVNGCPLLVFRQEGNIESLVKSVYEGLRNSSFSSNLFYLILVYCNFSVERVGSGQSSGIDPVFSCKIVLFSYLKFLVKFVYVNSADFVFYV